MLLHKIKESQHRNGSIQLLRGKTNSKKNINAISKKSKALNRDENCPKTTSNNENQSTNIQAKIS